MNHENFFQLLPSEVIVDIISRLPIGTILMCKCVCDSWSNLLESDYFVQYHLSKSIRGLLVQNYSIQQVGIYEFVDWNIHNLRHTPLRWFAVNELNGCANCVKCAQMIKGSVNGLLFMCDHSISFDPTINIVNPATHEYINICCSPLLTHVTGFGVSQKTGQYKVIRIYGEYMKLRHCEVYTLGTGSWRTFSIPDHVHNLKYVSYSFGALVNGNLHWLVYDSNGRFLICCLDLEYEHFSIFATPPLPARQRGKPEMLSLCALDDCLWLFDTSTEKEVAIWLLKDYGDDKSWKNEYVIRPKKKLSLSCIGDCVPIMVSEDGDSLVASTSHSMFHYSRKRDDVLSVYNEKDCQMPMYWVLHTWSFLSLNGFGGERVRSLEDDCRFCS